MLVAMVTLLFPWFNYSVLSRQCNACLSAAGRGDREEEGGSPGRGASSSRRDGTLSRDPSRGGPIVVQTLS